MRRAIFLDRDGVINRAIIKEGKPYPPRSLLEFELVDNALEALTMLKAMHFLLIVVTNQPDVARGTLPYTTVDAIHQELLKLLPLDEILVCLHDDSDDCTCRKPLPGLLLRAAENYSIDLEQSFMIGDRWKDIAAGNKANCKTIWINQNYSEKLPENYNYEASSLLDAAQWLLNRTLTVAARFQNNDLRELR